jgi:hypothetical protein
MQMVASDDDDDNNDSELTQTAKAVQNAPEVPATNTNVHYPLTLRHEEYLANSLVGRALQKVGLTCMLSTRV